jgi:23S rRNA (guanosine2251-2'-O)-methyltransferase
MNRSDKKILNHELGRLSVEEFLQSEKLPLVIVLDNVRSLHNVGSVFRTGDAFRISEIHLCGHTGTPPNKEISKTALGATETVRWKHFASTHESIAHLRNNNFKICSVEQTQNSMMLNQLTFKDNEKIALIFGNEVYGVDEEVVKNSDFCIEIPQLGFKHSLNISVSVGIVVWELCRGYFKK